jgi:hypothetical protein
VCFEEAVEYHERIGALPHLAMSRVELAAALNACGRSKEADICSAAALKDAVAYHLGGVLQRVNQLGLDGPHSVSSG